MATKRTPSSTPGHGAEAAAAGPAPVNPDTAAADRPAEPAPAPEAGGSVPVTVTGQEAPTLLPARTAEQTAVEAAPAADDTQDTWAGGEQFAPYPGEEYFHAGRYSDLFRAMGRRLVAEGVGQYNTIPGGDWTQAHERSYAAWQEQQGVEPTGIPDEKSWAALRVPRT